MKTLKLRIAKFDKLLVVEQLEKIGNFKETAHVSVEGSLFLFADKIDLQESAEFMGSCSRDFFNNQARDEYAEKLINWITEEQFDGVDKLEIGEPCLVRNDKKDSWEKRIYAGKVAKQLGEEKRFLATVDLKGNSFCRWRFAKPLNFVQLKIDGEIYTWETR